MSLKNLRVCDIFATTHKVSRYRLILTTLADDELTDSDVEEVSVLIDLCPRALIRLKKFVRRGLVPPPKDETDNEPEKG